VQSFGELRDSSSLHEACQMTVLIKRRAVGAPPAFFAGGVPKELTG